MRAIVHNDSLGNFVIHIKGEINHQANIYFKKQVEILMRKYPFATILIDMQAIDFVGSSGISSFVEILRGFNKQSNKLQLIHVKREFRRLFKLYDDSLLNLIIDEEDTTVDNRKLPRIYK